MDLHALTADLLNQPIQAPVAAAGCDAADKLLSCHP